jgi:hypothetical protein
MQMSRRGWRGPVLRSLIMGLVATIPLTTIIAEGAPKGACARNVAKSEAK